MSRRAAHGVDAAGLNSSTLARVIERLHPAVLDVLTAPRGLDVSVTEPVLHDPVDPVLPPIGAVVLAVGIDTSRGLVDLLELLRDAAVAAVVIKHPGMAEAPALEAAGRAGCALLDAPTQLSWGQLFSLLLTATQVAPAEPVGAPEAPLGDLFALANAVAAMVGGATTIEDPHSRVLAYSNLDLPIDEPRRMTILGRQVPSEWMQRLHDDGVFRRLWHSDEVVPVSDLSTDSGYLPRLAVAVRAGGELLGSIWVIEGEQPLGDEAHRALREAAGIAALHLIRHRAAHDVERRRRADALLAVLEDTDTGPATYDALGLDPRCAVTVVAFDVSSDDDDAGDAIRLERVADLVAVYCESYRRNAPCVTSRSRVYALLSGDETDQPGRLVSLAKSIVERAAGTLRAQLRAGVGSTVQTLDGVPHSRHEADQVLDVLRGDPGPRAARIDEVRARVVLHRLGQLAAENPELAAGGLAALVEQDATKGSAWVSTLRAYFDCFGDMAAAADQVNVHANTFRYRIRRITEVFGLNLDDADERLVLELQLRFLR